MDFSSSSASTLTRPRITLAILTAAAAASVGFYIFHEARSAPEHSGRRQSGRLHRSNAVRYSRHRSPPQDRPLDRQHEHEHDYEHDHEHELAHDHDHDHEPEPEPDHGHDHERQRRESNASSYTSVESLGDENVDLSPAQRQEDAETVVDDPVDDTWWDDPSQVDAHRAGQNIVSLLFRVSEDNARRNAYVHRGCACNACGIVPIRGIRYRCANCADFDLCETCESQGLHIKTHIFYKVKIPAPPFGPRQMQPVWYPGDPDSCMRALPKTIMLKLSRDTGFERPELEAFWEQWTFMANKEWRDDPLELNLAMDRKTFERCLVPSGGYRHTAPNLIHDRMFAFYDTNNDDLIGFAEFLNGLSYRRQRDKLRKIFDGYDVDRDGLVCRRDFLRIFRAYYVLYKQMHKDILEGLDDQVMSSSEAHQLVTGRQPLSGLFGREGRVPHGDDRRPIHGKTYHPNGEIELTDGRAEVLEDDQPDTSNREEVLGRLFSRDGPGRSRIFAERLHPSERSHSPTVTSDMRYWDALVNPPTRVDELPDLIMGDRGFHELFSVHDGESQRSDEDNENDGIQNSGTHDVSGNGAAAEALDSSREVSQGEDADGVVGVDASRRPTESELRAQHQSNVAHSERRRERLTSAARRQARKKLHDRWQRRQFYLDEEEGATEPNGWDAEDDVLARVDGAAESSKAAQRHVSARSRSSSKVRFAEEAGDYEDHSDHSDSTGSEPERQVVFEIPDAERDAGREILYQVTQQAFNELLDILFQEKEDLAIRSTHTRWARDKYRHLFKDLDSTQEAAEEATEQIASEKAEEVAEDKPPAGETLHVLLEQSGYSLRDSDEWTVEDEEELPELVAIQNILEEEVEEAGTDSEGTRSPPSGSEVGYRDPTMPQFRPNNASDGQPAFTVNVPSGTDSDIPSPSSETVLDLISSNVSYRKKATTRKRNRGDKANSSESKSRESQGREQPTRKMLLDLKRIDETEQEAVNRGGWGRLSYDEFEKIYRAEESQSNRLDYLGSWIDFCIP